MQPNNPSSHTLSEALSKISFAEYQKFSEQLFKQVTIEVLIHGNWLTHHAHQICDEIAEAFSGNVDNKHAIECPVTDISDKQTLLLPINLPDHDHACVIYTAFRYAFFGKIAVITCGLSSLSVQPTYHLGYQKRYKSRRHGHDQVN
jgi:secreted Zn-dependent insulinase-like peptidase